MDEVRIDKWLWAVRICKTRSEAADLCRSGKVTVNNLAAKPSRDVKPGQQVTLRRDGIDWQYKVINCIEKRVGSKVAVTCYENLTPEETLRAYQAVKSSRTPSRPRGEGRPTKKDRRSLEKLRGY
jgi:ribosome-associated heat shock protein Hsp15